MRRAEEEKLWDALKKSRGDVSPSEVSVGNLIVDIAAPCLVLGGRNGAGKSRFLRSLDEHLNDRGLYIDLHHLCEQALGVLRSRDDFDEMKEEFEVLGPDHDRRKDVERIIGREYEKIDWYALEVEPSDSSAADRFRWGGDQSLIPFFNVRYRGLDYSSRDMGLGEFSVHFLFWILDQYRDKKDLVLLLDEPDAYLPPVGVASLLTRLLGVCLERGWNIVLATHSTEMIGQAVDEEAFVLLRTEDDGSMVSVRSADDPTVADSLLARPPIRHVVFVEDESAWNLARVLLETMDRRVASSTALVWGNGAGYMVELQRHVPRPPRPEISFAFLFDGDQRTKVKPSKRNRWPALFLPTDQDPDDLYKSVRSDVPQLAVRLNTPTGDLPLFLDSIEGQDAHDWVNDLGERYGRPRVLRVLAEMWVETNSAIVESFLDSWRKSF